jgi:L-arabinokinase
MTVVSTAPAFLFHGSVGPGVDVETTPVDVGLAQHDALTIDTDGTLVAWRGFMESWDARVDAERRRLSTRGARVVVGDIPPLAFAAAARASVPSVALANFSWDWIYGHYARSRPEFAALAESARREYARATQLLRLPFAGDLSAFPDSRPIPLVARRPLAEPGDVRRRLGFDARPLALLSFGGLDLELPLAKLASMDAFQFATTAAATLVPANVRRVDGRQLHEAGWTYIDLVAAADVVVSKPGYGIVSDCIGARRPLIYTDRGDFPEYPILVREMPEYLPAFYVSREALMAGDFAAALDAAVGAPFPKQTARTDGAEVAAEQILAFARA